MKNTISNEQAQSALAAAHYQVTASPPDAEVLRRWAKHLLVALATAMHLADATDEATRSFHDFVEDTVCRYFTVPRSRSPLSALPRLLRRVNKNALSNDEYAQLIAAASRALSNLLYTTRPGHLMPIESIHRAATTMQARVLTTLAPVVTDLSEQRAHQPARS